MQFLDGKSVGNGAALLSGDGRVVPDWGSKITHVRYVIS
jgi:hypothetical protein